MTGLRNDSIYHANKHSPSHANKHSPSFFLLLKTSKSKCRKYQTSKHQEVNRLVQEVHWPINEVDKYKSTAHFALYEWS